MFILSEGNTKEVSTQEDELHSKRVLKSRKNGFVMRYEDIQHYYIFIITTIMGGRS